MVLFYAVSAFLIVAVPYLCAWLAISLGSRPRSRQYLILAATLGVLAGLAPISVVLFLRLSVKMCPVLNLLGLPWAEPWREIAHWGGGVIWLASTVCIVAALFMPKLRRAGIAMLIWSGISVVPTTLLLFLIVYGDPAAGCVAG